MLSPRVRTPGQSLFGTPARVAKNAPSSKIRVVARVRPFLPSEEGESNVRICKDSDSANTLHIDDKSGRNESYKLDFCYGEQDHVNYIFMMELEPILPVLFRGCNATVFAYGATGSGKTHTMQGAEEEGLIPLSMMSILSLANAVEAIVEMSYYEVYMDRCYDLLELKSDEISILEDTTGRIQLRGLSQVQVNNIQEFQTAFLKGCARRKVGQTGLNDVSSRSHAILTVTITTGAVENIDKMAVGKLNLIDLAGNEDNRRSGNDGVRLAESSRINQSLFALSNVINALNTNENRIPYRDSKLTRILQDSLGGTSCALMIACLNPGSYQEAVHTLSLAAKSRQIVNKFVPIRTENEPQEAKIDMEAKLKAWREAKGKTCGKSPARFFSPLQNRAVNVSVVPHSENSRLLQKIRTVEPKTNKLRESDKASQINPNYELTSNPRAQQASEEIQADKENVAQMHLFLDTSRKKLLSPISPPLSANLRNLGSALREALSPLPSNLLNPLETRVSPNKFSSCNSEQGTLSILEALPDSPPIWTPLEKFNMTSRNVQDTLLKKYLDVLNKGSREELLALRGIGEKRADYILKLRETDQSPIKELQDLQKIGLSEKHACTIFNGNIVRRIWTTPSHN